MLFTAYNNGVGPYFSNNGGYTVATISPTAVGAGNFYGCAMSASGQYILVANLTTVYLSSNFLTMPLSATYSSAAYTSVLSVTSTVNSLAMSASGQYAVFAYSASATTGGIYLSSNYGATWALVSGTNYPWQSVSMSSSGQYITACCNGTPNNIYISSNGASFSLPSTSLSSIAGWTSVKVSSSGQYQVACANYYVYYSSDFGMTWTVSSMSSSILWGCVAISPSGKYMLAGSWGNTSYVYSNSNYGAGAWTQQANSTNKNSYCMNVSSTGTITYASDGGTIMASVLTTAAAPLLAPALAMGTNPNATANALLSVYTANTSGVGTNGGGAIALGMNYGSPATGLFGGAGDKLILYHGTASSYPYSIGVDTSKFYCSVPTGVSYGWIIGGTQRMTLDSSGNVGIGTATPSDSFVVNSGSIVINNSAAAPAGYLFNQNSVWGGMEVEGIPNTGAQTINIGVNTNRTKTWSSSYGGLFFRIDTRTGYNGFHFFNRAVTTGTDTEIMTILSNGNVGIGVVAPTNLLQVAGRSLFGYIPGSRTGMFIDNETSYGTTPCIQGVSSAFGTNPISINPAGGNVGIGTVNPGYSLDVAGITRSAGVINTVPAHYIGYTNSSPTVYKADGTNNTSGSFYSNNYNYIAFPTNIQTPAGFITAVGGKYTLAYSGIYAITFTTGTGASNNQQLETFISKNGYNNSSDLNVPGTITLASSYHPTSTAQWCFSWTGYLSSSDFFCVGFFTSATSGSLNFRTTLSVALVNRTG
jgi:hypothetical protein